MSTENATPPAYSSPIDFKALAKKDECFRAIWRKSCGCLDFQDPETTKTLAQAILRTDFGLGLTLPDDRLCPPVPNRWIYVSWMQNLIDSTSPNYGREYDPQRKVVGLDIGTGASAIYTMLCLKTRPNWSMCATDVDKESFDSAVGNLTSNQLAARTSMLQVSDSSPLIPIQRLGVERLDFTICNPPFYENEAEMRASLKGEGKSWRPNAVCTGSLGEMVCPGGDVGFVVRIVEESLVLREKVTWYSSMLGKLSSAKSIVDLLKKLGITNWAVGCIDAGGPTKRWMIAWSFDDYRPCNALARIEKIANEYLPFPTEFVITIPGLPKSTVLKDTIRTQLSSLDILFSWEMNSSSCIGEASENVWKRAYRREHERKLREREAAGTMDVNLRHTSEKRGVALVFKISIHEEKNEAVLEWLKGTDQVLWESFCGMMHRLLKK